jgi:hypothetical protein
LLLKLNKVPWKKEDEVLLRVELMLNHADVALANSSVVEL